MRRAPSFRHTPILRSSRGEQLFCLGTIVLMLVISYVSIRHPESVPVIGLKG